MRIRLISLRSQNTRLWRFGVLTLVAIVLGAGIFGLVRRSAERSASTAVLSFDPSVAARNDAAITQAAQPAAAVAQSMLTESAVLDLLRKTGAPVSDPTVDLGEFRSRIDLQEPSLQRLQVRYRDPDPRQARVIADAVASAIANWTPSPPAPAAPQPAAASPPAVRLPPPLSAPEVDDLLQPAYQALADLEGQLARTDEKIGDLNRQPSVQAHAAAPPPLTAAQNEQRRALEAKLAAAHQKLDDLRVRYTDEYPDVENTKDTIAELQHELAAYPSPASPPAQPAGSSEASKYDAEIARLRAERGRLIDQIAVEKRTIVRLRAHPASRRTPSALKSESAIRTQVIPAPPVSTSAVWQSPFRIAHLASLAPSSLAWPTVLAGLLCTFFYAAAALGLFLYWRREMQATRPQAAVHAGSGLPAAAYIAKPEPSLAPQPAAVHAGPGLPAAAYLAGPEPTLAPQPAATVAHASESDERLREWTPPAHAPEKFESSAPAEPQPNSAAPEPFRNTDDSQPLRDATPDAAGEIEPGAAALPEPQITATEPSETLPEWAFDSSELPLSEVPGSAGAEPGSAWSEPVLTSQPAPEPEGEPDSQAEPELHSDWSESAPEPALNGAPKQEFQHRLDSVPEPMAEPELEPQAESAPEPALNGAPKKEFQHRLDSMPEPMAEPELEPQAESAPEPALNGAPKLEFQHRLDSVPEPTAEPELESQAEPQSAPEPPQGLEIAPNGVGHEDFRNVFVDHAPVDGDLNARLLKALSRTSIGRMFEIERFAGETSAPGDTSLTPASDAAATQPSERPSPQVTTENEGRPARMTDTRKFGS
jgi:hypothetical protein